MPCYEPREPTPKGQENARLTERLAESERDKEWLEAAMCALLSEIDKRGLCEEIVVDASRGGLIDLVGFWATHRQDDRARITKLLHQYSEHEQKIMLDLLAGQNK